MVGPTVTSAEPETVPVIAVILADPTATPVTTPVPLTVAIVLSEDDHSNVTPISWAPAWSNATAESCAVLPTAMLLGGALTVTYATVAPFGPLALPPQDRPAVANRQRRSGRLVSRR